MNLDRSQRPGILDHAEVILAGLPSVLECPCDACEEYRSADHERTIAWLSRYSLEHWAGWVDLKTPRLHGVHRGTSNENTPPCTSIQDITVFGRISIVRAVSDAFGGLSSLALALGVPSASIKSWLSAGIPLRWRGPIIDAARRNGVTIPREFENGKR